MHQLLKEYTTEDGCVTFVMHPRTTIDVEIAQDQLDRDLPDLADFSENIQNLAYAYKLILAHTEDIRFSGVDENSEWHDFKQWWESGKNTDEPTRFASFRGTFGRDEINTWVDAFDATRSKNRKAPETLHPGAEEKAAQDPDFLEGGSETPANGGTSLEESPEPKKQSRRNKSDSAMAAQNAS